MIELSNLVKKFGTLTAVAGIDLVVPRGEFFAALGPNAAGKTTTIKMMAGLIKPTSGTVRIAGFDVQEQPLEARRRLAYVPDFPFLYDKLTPWEFLRFTGQLFRMTDQAIDRGARELASRFNLEPYLAKPIEGLSHGTRQRVAIVSALLHDPEVFILDEPMVGLDPHHARVLKDILKERSIKGMTVFISTHQLSVAEEMADRIGIIHYGKLIAVGTRDELRRQSGMDGALEQSFLALTAQEATLMEETAGQDEKMTGAIPSPLRLILGVNLRQGWRRLISTGKQNRLLTAVIFAFIGGYFALAFWLFYRALRFVETFPGLGGLLVERLLYLLFAFLFVLLLFSNVVIAYSNFFRNRETAFLLSLPIPNESIFRWKFLESALLASWAFIFLIAPLLSAYGLTHRQPWHFYLVTSALVVVFVALPSVAGSWVAVNLARYMDRKSFQVSLVLIGAAALAIGTIWLRPDAVTDEMLETRVLAVLDRMLMKTRFTMFPLLPSYWLSTGVLNWAERAFSGALFFALVLLANALFFGLLAFTKMGAPFYAAASAVQSRGTIFGQWEWFRNLQSRRGRTLFPKGPLERVLRVFMPRLRSEYLALLVKDIRVFWRDTTQWGQTLVLFGLLAVYVINLRHFSQQLTNPFWVNLVSFLNLGACSLNLATLTTRFVYPQFSLEGKRVWIVGMAPLGLVRVVKTKFALTSFSSLALTLGLITLSCHLLKLPLDHTLFFAISVTVMTFTLNGLATGLGVLYPNFREENPSKIVSGFGGTFCLVLSFLYIVGAVALLAVGSPWAREGTQPIATLALSWSGFALLSLLIGWAPLKLALRKAAQFEY